MASSVDTSTSTRLFVGGLAYALTEFQLLKVCKRFGTIANLHFPHEKLSGKPMGFAFVEFETHTEAAACLAGLQGKSMLRRAVTCEWAVKTAERGSGDGGGAGGAAGAGAKPTLGPKEEMAAIQRVLHEMDVEDAKYAASSSSAISR